MQPLVLLSAKGVADHNPGTNGKAIEEKDRQIHDHGRRPDGGQRLCADKIAHDDRVDGVVEHLKDIAPHQWQREHQNLLCDRATGHILCLIHFLI